ncbi:glycosyl transferase family 1 [Pseudoalteromonas luteoviolacea]|uniref:Glycosyl transferase family 1 n=1 Tax=Pseudoalteromonas luteoviolacea TaxID=43657 RepID=A0A0C1QBF8_9GAMM|nr:glycosyltransferase family 4 protein [Pseudoalteromonas luteoviolacea]KID57956.1 glycosyl transferase family 1 [Pseudoalteromonas luteoviolacea]
MKKKLLFIVNVDWFFISHRLPIALKAIKNGYEVHIACGITDRQKELEGYGICVHPLPISRSGTNILQELKVITALNGIVKKVSPDVAHMVTIKGAIYGGLVTRFQKVARRVASISGLGFVFIDDSFKAKVLRFFVTKLYNLACGNEIKVIFQNKNDKSIFLENNIITEEQSILIRGSGVCLETFKMSPEPDFLKQQKVVMFLARLLKDKGVGEFCEAAKQLQNECDARFVLVGDVDPGNPNSLSEKELTELVDSGLVEHWGYSKNVEQVIPRCHIMVLPSYREGLPKSLIEAAACGRAVITTDVPGCRDAIEPNVSGLLVNSKNVEDLASSIASLLESDERRAEFGRAGRKLAERCFDINSVVQTHMNIYEGNS